MCLYIVPVKTGSVVDVDWLFFGLKVILREGVCTCFIVPVRTGSIGVMDQLRAKAL